MSWDRRRQRGTAADLHALAGPDPPARAVWELVAEAPAVVLGSTQDASILDQRAVAAGGWEVARRRSGGGIVVVGPGECTWVDVFLPAGDPLWDDDVGRAVAFVGEAWARALAGVAGGDEITVHRPPMERSPWSDLVCMAGRGPGEVAVGGAKVVGISQRRTRAGARFQCAVLHRWEPAVVAGLLGVPAPASVADLAASARTVPEDAGLVDRFVAALPGQEAPTGLRS